MRSAEVCVIGGGASGMMAAIEAGRRGSHVLLLEKKSRVGKKLLATGNGRCNFTNRKQSPACYHSEEPELPWNIIRQFDEKQSAAWFETIGVPAWERDGYLYPLSGQAASVLRALERELALTGAEIHTEETVLSIEKRETEDSRRQAGKNRPFQITTDKGIYLAGSVILATGGMASPVHGSTGDGYLLAEKLGHSLIPPVPALTSLIIEGKFAKRWSGARIKGTVSLSSENGDVLAAESGEIQLTAGGISGIPVFQLSHLAAREMAKNRQVFLTLDSVAGWSETELKRELLFRREHNEAQSFGDLLDGILPEQFAAALLLYAGEDIRKRAGDLSEPQIGKMASLMKQLRLPVKGTGGFEKAQATAGGVPVGEIDPETMESLCCKGLYLTGELLDVNGCCGGYNLQWAWTTGYLAAQALSQRESRVEKKSFGAKEQGGNR